MRVFKKDTLFVRYSTPDIKFLLSGVTTLIISTVIMVITKIFSSIPDNIFIDKTAINSIVHTLCTICYLLLVIGIVLCVSALIIHIKLSEKAKIVSMVRQALFCYEYGNPLHLKENELLPSVKCAVVGIGVFDLIISATTCKIEDIENLSSVISASLNRRKLNQYAVTQTRTDIAFNYVSFRIEDVTIDKSLIINEVKELYSKVHTKLIVQQDTYIDLTTSGSILCAGKTRSGKTTGIISLLIQALLSGRDNYGSEVIIIDPKQAELSRLPHVYSLDDNGEAKPILKAIKHFADTIVKRQRILNELSDEKGDAVKWWEAGFHVSFLFIDEYVALRSLLPKRASKENTEYCLDTFDGLIKRIVTMGASAGCYGIISIAEASVGEGGISSMLKSATSTKILFKPTMNEARLIWDSEKLEDLNNGRVYNAGDAWFSSTDGIHDDVSYVHFPIMRFPVYKELGRLLDDYYKDC